MTERDILTLNLVDRKEPSAYLQEDTSTCWNEWEAFRKASAGSDQALFADPHDGLRPNKLRWLLLSLAFQVLVVGFWALYSVTSASELPPPRVVRTFLTVAPTAPAPPPPAAVRAPKLASDVPSRRAEIAAPRRLANLELPAVPIETADMAELADYGAFGEDHDGLDIGGVPGGVIGGLVGGLGKVPSPNTPDPQPTTVYVVSGELERPDKLVHVDPVYPGVASLAHVEGVVILEATIDGDGNIQNLRVLRSIPLLDHAALDAVKNWKYEPTVIAGKPVQVQMTVTVSFRLA